MITFSGLKWARILTPVLGVSLFNFSLATIAVRDRLSPISRTISHLSLALVILVTIPNILFTHREFALLAAETVIAYAFIKARTFFPGSSSSSFAASYVTTARMIVPLAQQSESSTSTPLLFTFWTTVWKTLRVEIRAPKVKRSNSSFPSSPTLDICHESLVSFSSILLKVSISRRPSAVTVALPPPPGHPFWWQNQGLEEDYWWRLQNPMRFYNPTALAALLILPCKTTASNSLILSRPTRKRSLLRRDSDALIFCFSIPPRIFLLAGWKHRIQYRYSLKIHSWLKIGRANFVIGRCLKQFGTLELL